MPNELVPPPEDGLVKQFIDHWLGGLHLPGAVKAVSRLVVGVGAVPAAGLEWVAARVEDDSRRRSAFANMLSEAAKRQSISDPDFASRALAYETRRLVRDQINREAVAVKAVEHLLDTPPPQPSVEAPSDEFMDVFADQASRASAETMRDLFGRVLAGEIRQPGTFSIRTVQFLSVVDTPLAATISKARNWIAGEQLYITKSLNQGLELIELGHLADVSILRAGLASTLAEPTNGRPKNHVLVFGDELIALYWKENGLPISLPVYYVTPMGREIMSLIPFQKDENYISELVAELSSLGVKSFKRIALGKIMPSPPGAPSGSISWQDAKTLWESSR